MKKIIKPIKQHCYTLKKKRYKNILKKYQKNIFKYPSTLSIGDKIYYQGKYYGTIVSITKKVVYLDNEEKPMQIPNPFLKETLYNKNFIIKPATLLREDIKNV